MVEEVPLLYSPCSNQHHGDYISTLQSSEPFPHLEEHAPPFETI